MYCMEGFSCRVWKDLAARLRRIQLPGVESVDCMVEMDLDARHG
jgi:hypothetical protein